LTLTEGNTTTLKITGTKKKITWSSSKKSVATVSSKGKVIAKKKGTATITAKVGKKKYTCKVMVKEKTATTPSNPQDAILSKITKKYTVGKYYGSNWKNVVICQYKNNSGYDLIFNVTAKFGNTKKCNATSANWYDDIYFANGSELALFYNLDYKYYDFEYTVKKATQYTKDLYSKITLETNVSSQGDVNYVFANNATDSLVALECLTVYFDSNGNVIDFYDCDGLRLFLRDTLEGRFEPPTDANLNQAKFAHYTTYYKIILLDD
jgi:hypothetical protein